MTIYIATQNKNKLREMRAILAPLGIEVEPHPAYEQMDVEETGTTFEENASIKAATLSALAEGYTLADDSGLVVDALNGAPGVYSARYASRSEHLPPRHLADARCHPSAGGELPEFPSCGGVPVGRGGSLPNSRLSTDELNNALLLKNMQGVENRRARFVCVIALALDGKVIETFRGECEGSIAHEVAGDGGFGYDPLFLLPDGRTMAQLSPDEKNTVSHRAQALSKLAEYFSGLPPAGVNCGATH